MTFKDHANSLINERAEFVKKIAELTLVSEATVSRWISGEFIPSKIRREIIAREMNIPVEELFPETHGIRLQTPVKKRKTLDD